ncbi:hypothetical protein [Chelativorans salis]|uniref:Alkaline proteinase inhibitor/ Outer membrane lipoprotein Omp19 domain-containing protein n=1 Tax=Chelativorans salis TaxID=2978478 RepID=A0ABT2LT91_9HYPH|nr:hypothetical protein [Chelativorans sp. EGI FJ00035]MCT7377735.1 hypothetical protein [Chelativorans sp. EGI FJ00035]
MKSVLVGLVVMGVGALAFVASDQEGTAAADPSVQERQGPHSHYRLRVAGRDGSCTIAKGKSAGIGRAEIELAADCVLLMPRLSEARYWREGADRDVAFEAADGRVIAEFYAADGVAYESLTPAAPLMALTVR